MRRYTRRKVVVGGAALATAGAAGGAFAWGRAGRGPSATPPASPEPTVTPVPAPARGGVARFAAPAQMQFDTFDAARSGEPTVVEVLGRTHSRLVRWADPTAAVLVGDIVERWEMPDPWTWVFHLRQGVRWHDRPPLGGRGLLPGDVVAHFARLRELADSGAQPMLQRAWDYASIARVTAPDNRRLVVETSTPDPFLLNTLAGPFALVQAPEAVEAIVRQHDERSLSTVVGTGPFALRAIRDDGSLLFDAHRTGHRPPLLDGLEVSQPYRVAERFIEGAIDEAFARDRRDAARVREAVGSGAREHVQFENSPIITGLFAGSPPWSNPNLVRALSAGLNRLELSRRLLGGRATPAGPVAPVFSTFALPESELAHWPGYRPDVEADRKDARRLWEAGGGPALGAVTIDFPSIFDPRYSASSVVCGMLNESLGVTQFRPAVESYTTIGGRVASGSYGNGNAAFWFGWGPPFGDPDPARFLVETYRSDGSGARSTGFRSAEVDRLIEALGSEFDTATRRAIIGDVQRALLAVGGGGIIDWLVQRSELFRPLYLGRGPEPTPFASQHLDDAAYLDSAEASFGRRTV